MKQCYICADYIKIGVMCDSCFEKSQKKKEEQPKPEPKPNPPESKERYPRGWHPDTDY